MKRNLLALLSLALLACPFAQAEGGPTTTTSTTTTYPPLARPCPGC